jgi:flagellar P-ring protein precursor FlgI
MRSQRVITILLLLMSAAPATLAGVRVQDIARLQGQRTNKLMGYGLVVGLPGTGDGDQYLPTMRALAALHQRYHQPILSDEDISGNGSVALVAVEATIGEFGGREGQTLDVTVSTLGTCESLRGGQLLTTPLQFALFDPDDPRTQGIFALAGGSVFIPDDLAPTRGTIRSGATLEMDCFYGFIQQDTITLVLNDTHAGWSWSHVVARAINHELTNPALKQRSPAGGQPVVAPDAAFAAGPKNVVVHIPTYELADPANYISRVLQAPLFLLPEPEARVTINRTTKNVSFTASVTVSPTVLQVPGVGTIQIGQADEASGALKPVEFGELFTTLSAIQVTPDQMIDAIEHLHKTGTLHAQLRYE